LKNYTKTGKNGDRDLNTELIKRDEIEYLNIVDSSEADKEGNKLETDSKNSLEISAEILPMNNPPS